MFTLPLLGKVIFQDPFANLGRCHLGLILVCLWAEHTVLTGAWVGQNLCQKLCGFGNPFPYLLWLERALGSEGLD